MNKEIKRVNKKAIYCRSKRTDRKVETYRDVYRLELSLTVANHLGINATDRDLEMIFNDDGSILIKKDNKEDIKDTL